MILQPTPTLPTNIQPVPLTYREIADHCGPAVVRAVIRYRLGRDVPELDLVGQLKTTNEEGTAPDSIVRVLGHDYGLEAVLVENATIDDLRSVLKRGETAILNLQAWLVPSVYPERSRGGVEGSDLPPIDWDNHWDDGHYIVLVGLDDHFLYAMDPSIPDAYGYLPLAEFEERWHDEQNLEDGTERRYLQSFFRVTGGSPVRSVSTPTSVLVQID